MNVKSNRWFVLLIVLLSLLITVPVMAHGDDPEEETSAEISDDHREEANATADHKDQTQGSSNARYVISGIIGAVLLAAGASFLFSFAFFSWISHSKMSHTPSFFTS